MIGWIVAGVIGVPFGWGMIKGAINCRKPSRYEQNLKQIIAEREARDRTGLPDLDVRTQPVAEPAPWIDARVNGRFVKPEVKQLFDAVEGSAPVPNDMPQGNSFGQTINRGHNIPAIIKYIDANGKTTTRLVTIHSLNATMHKDGTVTLIYFVAYCHTRNGDRTFYFANVQAAGNTKTGEVIADFPDFALREFGRSNPIRRIAAKPRGTV